MRTGILAAKPQSVSYNMWKLCAAAKDAALLKRSEGNGMLFSNELDARKMRKLVLEDKKGNALSYSWKAYLASRQIQDVAAGLTVAIFSPPASMAIALRTDGYTLSAQFERPAILRRSDPQLTSNSCTGRRSPAIPVRSDEASPSCMPVRTQADPPEPLARAA
jgi:hypothetical protein